MKREVFNLPLFALLALVGTMHTKPSGAAPIESAQCQSAGYEDVKVYRCSAQKADFFIMRDRKPVTNERDGNFNEQPWNWVVTKHWRNLDSYCGDGKCSITRTVSETVSNIHTIGIKAIFKSGDYGGEGSYQYTYGRSTTEGASYTKELLGGTHGYIYQIALEKKVQAPIKGAYALFKTTQYYDRGILKTRYYYKYDPNYVVGTWQGTLQRNFQVLMCSSTNPTPADVGDPAPSECRPSRTVANSWYTE